MPAVSSKEKVLPRAARAVAKKPAAAKKLPAHRVEQAFRLAVKIKEKILPLRRRLARSIAERAKERPAEGGAAFGGRTAL